MPLTFGPGQEVPNPVPNVTSPGDTISLYIEYPAGTTAPATPFPSNGSGTLTDSKGASIPVVYLDRAPVSGPDPSSFTFSKAPRQMTVSEVGPSPLHARYVPID